MPFKSKMKLYVAMACSVLLHFLIFNWLSTHCSLKKMPSVSQQILQVSLKGSKTTEYKLIQSSTTLPEIKQSYIDVPNDSVEYAQDQQINVENKTTSLKNSNIEVWSNYLPTEMLDRKAIPISNIDISMVNGVFISGLPIKLRIYINLKGTVVKIEEISLMEQDKELKNRLIDLLVDTTFLPAKKEGRDVDSYQDIEFSF